MLVVAAYLGLLLLAVFLFVSIRNDGVQRIKPSQMADKTKNMWIAALGLMAIPLVMTVLSAIGGLVSTLVSTGGPDVGDAPPPEINPYWLDIAFTAPTVLLVACFVLAFWRPASAAILLLATAVAAPIAPLVQVLLPLPDNGDPTNQFPFFAPPMLLMTFSIPAVIVAVLLWRTSRGLSPGASQSGSITPERPSTTPTGPG